MKVMEECELVYLFCGSYLTVLTLICLFFIFLILFISNISSLLFGDNKDPFNDTGKPPESGSKEWHEWFRGYLGDTQSWKEYRRGIFNIIIWTAVYGSIYYLVHIWFNDPDREEREIMRKKVKYLKKYFLKIGHTYPRSGELPIELGFMLDPDLFTVEQLRELSFYVDIMEIHNIHPSIMTPAEVIESLDKIDALRDRVGKNELVSIYKELEKRYATQIKYFEEHEDTLREVLKDPDGCYERIKKSHEYWKEKSNFTRF